MKLPKMYRKKRGGRYVGSWRVMIDGSEVNLGTSDAEAARPRLRQAVQHGKRRFDDEAELAADLEGAREDEAPAEMHPPPSTSFEIGSVVAPPPPAPPPPPPADPAPELPAPSQDAGDAEDMAAAAADVAAGSPANDNAAAAVLPIDNSVLDGMLEQGGAVIVDLQLALQAYAIKRGTGLVAGAIPPDSKLRTDAAKAWVQQLKIWFPSTTALPPWAVALILPAMALPAQLAGARPPTKEELEAEEKEKHADPPMAAAQ
jgi:hypothetical protein